MRSYLSGNELTDAEVEEVVIHNNTFQRGGDVFALWRFDIHGTPWFRRVPSGLPEATQATHPKSLRGVTGKPDLTAPAIEYDDEPIEWISADDD